MSANSQFRSDIQGLRAIAIVSVVVFHGGAAWLKGGFIGVDIFFVISGYLITKILLKENAAGTYSLLRFYQRRMRRLLPALVIVLAASLAVGLILLSASDMRKLGITAAATMLFSSNFVFYLTSDYFGGAAEYQPLLHTWSLAVEEQFYILFPLLLALVWKRARRLLVPLMVGAIGVSLISSVVGGHWSPSWDFYLPLSRAYELLIGAVVAAKPDLLARLGTPARNALSIVGLVLLAGSLLLIDEEYLLIPGYIALFPCIGAALIIATGQSAETIGGKLISSAPFQFFGNISYSLYLWHWPVLVFARHFNNGPLPGEVSFILVGVAIVLAWLSYTYVERPFVSGLPSLKVIRLGGLAIAGFALIGAVMLVTDGLEARFSSKAQTIASARDDFNPERSRCHFDGSGVQTYGSTCTFGGDRVSVAVWGDSHGAELAPALGDELRAQGEGVREITSSACPPVLGYQALNRLQCPAQNEATMLGLKADGEIDTVILVAALEGYGAARSDTIRAGLERSVVELQAAGKTVVLLGPIPTQLYDPPSALSLRADDPDALLNWGRTRSDVEQDLPPFRAMLEDIASRTGAVIFDPTPVFCGDQICPAYDPEFGVLYFNQSHLSMAGARKLARSLLASLG